MTRLGLAAFGGLAAIFAGIIAIELTPEPAPAPDRPTASAADARGGRTREPVLADPVDRWVASILQRPLFAPDRRPPPNAAGSSGPAGPTLPRLAGTLVGHEGRRAIFATDSGGREIVVGEGEKIGAWIVQSIKAGEVAVLGPGGPRVMHPAFDKSAAGSGAQPGDATGGNAPLLFTDPRQPGRPNR